MSLKDVQLLDRDVRERSWVPTGAIAQTFPRRFVSNATIVALTSGTMRMFGGLSLPAGIPVSAISILSGTTAGAELTHSFVALYDRELQLLATSVDVTTASWSAQSIRKWKLATALRGETEGGHYTPEHALDVYVGLTVIGTTPPTLSGFAANGAAIGLAPNMHANSTSGLTKLADIPSTAAALGSAQTGIPYAYAS